MKTSANITGVFDLDTGRLIGLAPKGTSDVTYVAGQDTATPAGALPVTATTDPLTGGSTFFVGQKRTGGDGLVPSLVIFGDSRADDMSAADGIAAWSSLSVHAFAESISGASFRTVHNTGVGGNKIADLIARVSTDLYAYAPTDTVIMVGHNDFVAEIPTSVADVYAGLLTLFKGCADRGIYVHHLGEYPGNESATIKGYKLALNALCKSYWAANPGLGKWYDTASVIADPASSTWAAISGTLRDNIHMTSRAAYRVAGLLAVGYAERGIKGLRYMSSSVFDDPAINSSAINRMDNPLMTGGSGSTAPTGWEAVSGSPELATAARSDGYGSNFTATWTAQSGACSVKRGVSVANIVAGKSYRLSGQLKTAALTNVAGVYLTINWYDGTNWFSSGVFANYSDLGQSDAFDLSVESPELLFPGITFGEVYLGIQPTSGQSASGAISIARLTLA